MNLCYCTWVLVTILYVPSCGRNQTDVVFYVHDGYTFSNAEQRIIRAIAESAARDARRLLPDLPLDLIIRVNPGTKVIDEIGSSSDHTPPNVVHWMVDPRRPKGVAGIAQDHLRATLFFHLHRLTRLRHRRDVTLMEHVVSLGMATAFERDAGGARYPWGQYPTEVSAWVSELIASPSNAGLNQWMSRHPDGRRWVGMRAGTYIVDLAMRASGKTAAELVSVPAADLLRLANVSAGSVQSKRPETTRTLDGRP